MKTTNSNSCFLCLQKCNKSENVLSNKPYIQLISDIAGFKIDFTGHKQCNACMKCIRVLKLVQKFRETCRKNHLKAPTKKTESLEQPTAELEDFDNVSASYIIVDGDNEINVRLADVNRDEIAPVDLEQESERHECNVNPPQESNGCNRNLSPCYICGKLVNRSRLKYHINTHEDKRPYTCPDTDCNKSFPSPFQLKSHQKICHTDIYPFECMICGRKFKVHTSFIIHKSYHLNPELPCKVCGKLLRHKRALKKHMMSHTGERPFECNFCTKQFQNKYNLKVHQRSHTRDKPFKCSECDKCYGYNWLLKSHIMAKHTL